MFALLQRWWRRKKKIRLAHLGVVVYTRAGCHLCDDAWTTLQEEQSNYAFRLSSIDVDSDPKLKELYGLEVPVVAIDGKVRFRGRVNRLLLARLLEAEAAREKS